MCVSWSNLSSHKNLVDSADFSLELANYIPKYIFITSCHLNFQIDTILADSIVQSVLNT